MTRVPSPAGTMVPGSRPDGGPDVRARMASLAAET